MLTRVRPMVVPDRKFVDEEEDEPRASRRSLPVNEDEDEEEDAPRRLAGKFIPPSLDEINKKIAEIDRRKKKFWNPKEGPNTIRILPAQPKFYVEVPTHFIGRKGVTCRKLFGKKCPACETIEKWGQSDDLVKQKKAHDMDLQYRVYMNVVDVVEPDRGVQVWATSDTMLYKILAFFYDPEYPNFLHPQKGFDFMIKREGTGMKTKYSDIRLKRNPSSILYKAWAKEMHDLEKFSEKLTYEEVNGLIARSSQGDGAYGDE